MDYGFDIAYTDIQKAILTAVTRLVQSLMAVMEKAFVGCHCKVCKNNWII